jgi:hypothetical protein
VLPGNLLGIVLLLAAVAPGYVYVRVAERYQSRPERSALVETVELVAIGAACTTVAALLAVGLEGLVDSIVIDISTWASKGNAYLRARPESVARSIGLVLGGACVIAYLSARVVNRGRPAGIVPGITVRAGVFQPASRPGKRAWVAVHLKNGSIVEGYLLAYPTGESDAQSIALQKPIGLTDTDQPRALVPGVDRVIITADEITMLGVRIEDDLGSGPTGRTDP